MAPEQRNYNFIPHSWNDNCSLLPQNLSFKLEYKRLILVYAPDAGFSRQVLKCSRSCKQLHLDCVPLGWSRSGLASMIKGHSDHQRKPMNPFWARIHRFLWRTMIPVILDHWFWFGSSLSAPGSYFSRASTRLHKEAITYYNPSNILARARLV